MTTALINNTMLELCQTEGVKAVLLCSRDGFLIRSQKNEQLELEALSAEIISCVKVIEKIGKNNNLSQFEQSMVEYQQGTILITMVADVILSVITTKVTPIGALRYQLNRLDPAIFKNVI